MNNKKLKKKHGIVILLDALGASEYSESQIREFLSARGEINNTIKELSAPYVTKKLGNIGKFNSPGIFTFGDTVVITIELNSKRYLSKHFWLVTALMRRYLFHSFEKGIMYRGAFSIGDYVADSDSNTVMGDAITDAASWYEQSEWMGLSSTPKTNNYIEHFHSPSQKSDLLNTSHTSTDGYLVHYDVPLKSGTKFPMYAVDWPSAFFDETFLEVAGQKNAEKYFLSILKDQRIPKGTEAKYENTKLFFYSRAKQIIDKELSDRASTTNKASS